MLDDPPVFVRSSAHGAYLEDKALEALEAEAAAEEEDEDEDEDEEGGDEEAEGEDEDYGEEEPVDMDKADYSKDFVQESKEHGILNPNQTIYDKFNEVELDAFMKIMDIKPTRDWRDNTFTHSWMGNHKYEDENQELDPYFHIFGEVQRRETEEMKTKEWREGAEVKFELHEKRPVKRQYRF